MKKKDFKFIGIYYVLIIIAVIGFLYYRSKPKEIDYSNYTDNITEVNSVPADGTTKKKFHDGTLTVGVGNDGVYETDDYIAFISDITAEQSWVTIDLKDEYDFTQQIQDYSFLPNSEEFPNLYSSINFDPSDNMPTLIENELGTGWSENYLRDYKLWYYTVDIDEELQLCYIGWANNEKVDFYELFVLNNPQQLSDEFTFDAGKGELQFNNYEYSDVLLTEEDAKYITYYVDRYDKYPTKEEVDIKGVIPFEKYQELFELRPLERREVQYTVGDPLERYPGYEEEFK